MLPALGHYTFIRSYYHQEDINAACTGQHVFNQAFVARHIDNSDGEPIRVIETGKSQVDGDSALFLLFEPVGIDASQGLYKRTFAVIDMAGGTEDDAFRTMSGRQIHQSP